LFPSTPPFSREGVILNFGEFEWGWVGINFEEFEEGVDYNV